MQSILADRSQSGLHARRPLKPHASAPSSVQTAVLFLCDRNYHDLTLYSIVSLAMHHGAPLDIHFYQDGYTEDAYPATRERIESLGHRLIVRNTRELVAPTFSSRTREVRGYISDTALLKVCAIGQIAPAYDYVAYVDSDVLVFDDLRLQELAGFGQLCAGVLDFPMATGNEDPRFFDNCARNDLSTRYINAGFYIINSDRWLETDFVERYAAAVNEHNQICHYLTRCVLRDQCPFNMALGSDVHLLPLSYNVQRWALYSRHWQTAKLRHYTGGRKFLDPLPIRTDRREDRLMRRLEAFGGLPARRRRPRDFAALYYLNGFRRRNDIAAREAALDKLAAIAPAT